MTNPARLTGRTMELADIALVGPVIREADRNDCALHDCDPVKALQDAYVAGPAWTALWEGEPVGCFGWTYTGFIWSLWADLTREQSLAVMSRTPAVIKGIARQAAARELILCNTVREDNLLTIAWLRASKCFDFGERKVEYQGHRYLPFFVKPLGDL